MERRTILGQHDILALTYWLASSNFEVHVGIRSAPL